jgi:hypothetical protein
MQSLKMIANEIYLLQGVNTDMLSRYMRCLFMYCVSEGGEEAENILDQVAEIVSAEEHVCADTKPP